MVRETRHLWVGNLPENIREERIRDHFKRYGRVQSVKLLGRSGGGGGKEDEGGGGACATVSFMDIKSAAKAHHSEQKLDERTLTTEYHEPAAIPCPGTLYSGSGPPNPPGASTGSRFSSHGGSEDLSGSFERSSHFYERSERGETGASGYIRRGGSGSTSGAYHSAESLSRSRARDRLYRNGPYTPLIERDTKQRIGEPRKPSSENDDLVRHNRVVSRTSSSGHHRVSSSGWGYDSPSPRYSASGVPSTPELPYSDDRRETTPVVHKKHSKSGFSTQNNSYPTLLISISRRSGSDSPSNSVSSGSRSRSSSASSQSGSSTCSSASSSPASEKSCSTHSQQSSLRSGAQSGVSASHTNSVSPAVHAEDRRPLAICVRNLPARSSDTSLKDGLYHEYKKHGKVTWVKVVGQGVDRYALVCFKKADDVEKALQVSHDKLFFGCKIEVAPYQGYDVDDNEFRPFEAEQDEFHPKATRTLFIGNLEKDITTQEIRKHFDQFGEIIEIDIKKQGNSASYAFCQFSDISSVVRAMRTLDGEHIGANRIKLGFGKSMHTNCVWVDGVSETVSEKYLSTHFGQFGPVTHVVIDRSRGHALVFYEQISYAQQAVKDMRGNSLRGRKLQVDYASRECQEAFYDRIEKQSSTSHTNFDNSIQASPQSTSTIVRVYDNGGTATSPAVNSAPTRYPTLTTGGSGVVVTTRFNTTSSTSRTYNRPSASSPTTPSPSPRSSRHGHSSSQRFDYNLDYPNERRSSYRSYEDNPGCDESGNPSTMGGAGDVRHLQKDRVTLTDQLEDCTSSGEDTAAGRRRCSKHRRSQSGGESSRPGTPLCDERPDPPVEPRRAPRDRPPDPLSLPLPRFAAQVLSPRPVLPTSPASPQTPHSSSSDSEPSPPSPEWEERLRSLDEKYEKWSGSRSGVTKVDPSSLKFKHKFELDLNELQPSEIVKSVLAKRSVFDEDSKRLENFGEKYEPREFVPANRANVLRRLDMSPLSSPVNKSPGLQYPFPSHPPVQTLGSSGVASTSTIPALAVASEAKPNNTFLTNCTRQFTPKISSPSSSVETSPKPSTQPPADKFKTKCTPSPMPIPPPAAKKELVTTPPPKPKPCSIRRDSTEEKSELRRKSRDDVCPESVAKKDDISESDKVKDAQISERRKSSVDKRRNSVDIKDLIISKPLENSCDRPKDISDKQEERRRGSSEADVAPTVPTDPRIKPCDFKKHEEPNQSYDNTRTSETEKKRLTTSDSMERRKEVETLHRHSSTEIQDKKKDILGVNSEKDRRRARESVDSSSDNPKHNRKVPENKKEEGVVEKKEEEIKSLEHPEKKNKEAHEASTKSREKRESVDREKRRDSREELTEKNRSDKVNSELLDRFKDHKKPEVAETTKKKEFSHHDSDSKVQRKDSEEAVMTTMPRNSKKDGEHDGDVNKKDSKHKEERKKNSENEISKEHSLFKKVFGFADSIRHHKGGVDKRDNDTSTAVKMDTPEPNKHREKKKDKEEHSDKHKSCNRKSPDQPDNNRHKEEKRRHSESKKRDFETDDIKKEENHVQPEVKPHTKSSKKEDPSYKDSNHRNAYYEHNSSEHSKYNRDSERRKDSISEEMRKPENDLNCLENNKKEEDEFYERRKEDGFRSKENDRRKGSFDSSYDNNFDSSAFVKAEKKNDIVESSKYAKHERHRERDKSKDHDTVQNCRSKEDRKNEALDKHRSDKKKDCDGHRIKEEKKSTEETCLVQKDNDKKKDEFDAIKIKEDAYAAYRESIRKKEAAETQERLKEIERKKEDKERRKERELMREKENNDKMKSKHSRDYEAVETKINGDHDSDYTLDTAECRKTVITYDDSEHQSAKKEKKREKNSWPATIGCKRRLSSQDSIEINDDAKRIKPERRDSKDSGRSSGSSRKGSGEKHKGYKLLEEKIKEDKEKEQRKNSEETNHETPAQFDEKPIKPAIRKEKRNSGEKRKEKFKSRPRENGTASESDLASGDDEQQSKVSKRQQHSIFDIVDDEPAYISMYDKVKARSTKNMQKLEEEKKQEKLKEKFHALKQSRAKREEKKRSTSYDEDSDSEKGSMRRSSKLLLTSSEDDATSEPDVRVRKNKILYDTSEDDSVITTGKVRKGSFHEENKCPRKIISDISEDDTTTPPIKHSTPKVKVNRNITFDAEPKSRKIVSDTSEDDSTRLNSTPRILKPSRIHSDDSEGDLGFEDSIRNETKPLQNISDMFQSRPVEVNHFTNSIHDEAAQQPLQSSPESFRRNSLDSTTSEQHRKKSHKKKQKRQKNLEENEDGTIKKHSSKKDKKRAHRDKDDEEKRRKRVEKESINNKRDDKLEDIFGPLSDDSVKNMGNKWNVAQVYGSDSESERENIRKKEKKRREKKMRELDEAGRAIEAKLLDSCDNINLDEPVKTKKKKRKKSRDEKNKHHQREDEAPAPVLPKEEAKVDPEEEKEIPLIEIKEEAVEEPEETDKDGYEADIKKETKMEDEVDSAPDLRQHSMSSLLDSPPPSQPSNVCKKPGIPGFSSEMDENIHETAVKSISESPCTTLDESDLKFEDKSKTEEPTGQPEDGNPKTIISQEETEDAVAALLMEDAFGGGFEGYNEDTPKPDTPVSEPDLQIDTDTEDNYDPVDFSRPPRTPDIPSNFYRQNESREGLEERIMMSLACSSDSSLKESPRPLQMPPTPDHKPDKKDASDSDSFEPEKTQEKQSVVKQLVELTEDEPEDSAQEKKAPSEETVRREEEVAKTEPSRAESPKKVEDVIKEPERSDSPPPLSDPVVKPPPLLDMPKLIMIPQKVPAITINVSQPEVPSLVPLSSKSDFTKLERVHHIPSQLKPQVITSSESSVVHSNPAHMVSLLSPTSKNHFRESMPPLSQGWSGKTEMPKSMPMLTTVTIDLPRSQPPPLHPTHPPAPTVLADSAHPKSLPQVSPPASQPHHPPPPMSQPPPLILTSISKPPPLQPTLSKPPPLVHTSHTPMQVVSSAPLLTPRSDAVQPQPTSTIQSTNQQVFTKTAHRLPINPLPPLKPVLSTLPVSLHSSKTNTTVTLSTPNQNPATTQVRTIHPLASLTLVPTVKDAKASAPSPTGQIIQAKQLHVITSTSQLSPTPAISPQNLKLVRPSIPVTTHLQLPPLQNINIQPLKTPVISQHSPNRSHPPLLQTVNIDEHIKASPQMPAKTLIPATPNPQLLLTPIQAPHPEKVITLSPSQPPLTVSHSSASSLKPSAPVNVIKTSESAQKDQHPETIPAEKETKTGPNVELEVPPTQSPEIHKIVPTAQLSAVSPTEKPQQPKEELEKRTPEPLPPPKLEPKPASKPDHDETKPLNAVIQDLTLRAANKQQQPQPNWKPRSNVTAEPPKSEASRPLEQVVRELARKRQASESKELEKPVPTDDESKSDTETLKTDERLSDSEPLEPLSAKDDAKVEPKIEPLDVPKQEPVVKEDMVKVEDAKPDSPKRPPTPPAEEKPERVASPVPEKPLQEHKTPETKPEEEVKTPKSVPEKERQSMEKEVAPKADLIVSTPPTRGGRGGRKRKAVGGRGGITTRRTRANNAPTTPASTDVYEFRDDSEEETGRPRLILTIKSPPEPSATPKVQIPSQPVAQPLSPPPAKEKESGGGATTRKSRRLQEKDGGTKSSSDEIIEEIIPTRGRPSRRATRSTVQTLIPPAETTRKSPRRKQTSSSSSTLQVPAHNTRQRSASPAPPPVATSPAVAPSPSPTPSAPSTPSAAPRRSPTPQRPPSPAKASAPTPVVGSPAPLAPQPPPTPPQLSPQASTPVPQPQPVPTTQPQLPPPPDAATIIPVVTLAPTSVGQPTPPPTPSTPSSQPLTLVPSTTVTITSTHNPVSTVPAAAHAVSISATTATPPVTLPAAPTPIVLPAMASPVILPAIAPPVTLPATAIPVVTTHPQSLPVQLTSIHGPPQVQPTPGQPPPAHSGPAHSVASVHPVAGHRPPSAHLGQQPSAIKYRCKNSAGEPTKLIDPVTGLLIPMTESEEGQYIPVGDIHRTAGGNVAAHLNKEPSEGEPPEKRARLLNLVGKEEALARTPLPRPSVVRPTASQPSPSPPMATPPAAHSQPVKIMVPSSHPIEAHLGRGHQIPPPLMGGAPPKAPMSGVVPMTPKSHLLQAVTPSRMRPQAPPPQAQHSKGPMAPKAHILQAMGNAQAREGVVGSPAPHQGALLTGSVASPPLRAHQQPIVTGASSGRVLVKGDVPGTRVGDGKHIVVPSPSSQVPPPRSQVVQPGIPLSAYEASLHSVVAELLPNPPWSQRQSPPPAHQNSAQQGEQLQHVSSYPPHHHYVHPPFVFQPPYLREAAGMPGPYHRSAAPKGGVVKGADMDDRPAPPSAASASAMIASPPLELRRGSPHDRTTDSPQVVPVYMHRTGQQFYYEGPPHPPPPAHRPHNPPNTGRLQTPPHASQVPPQADSLLMLLQRYPVMWQGLLALKNDQAAVQMHFVFGNPVVARESLPCNSDGSTPPLRIAQRMRLEQTQVEGVARKMQMDNEHCMLLALPCGRDHMDVLQQSNNLQNGFITYLQQKQAAGIVNIAAPGSPQPAYVVHIFPSCDFANESLARIAPDLLHRVADLAHLLIVIATV